MKLALALMAMVAAGTPQQVSAPIISSIGVETTSWGRLIARWSIDDAGILSYTSAEPGPSGARQVVTRHARVGIAGYRRIHTMLAGAEAKAGRPMACTQAVTDAVYGNVTWMVPVGRIHKLNFYTACSEPATRQTVEQIGEANQLAHDWAMQGQIIKTEPGDTPQ